MRCFGALAVSVLVSRAIGDDAKEQAFRAQFRKHCHVIEETERVKLSLAKDAVQLIS